MATDVLKEPKLKRLHSRGEYESWSPSKKKRIKENFLHFCDIVLSYTKYESFRHDELRNKNNTSPLDSGGSTAESCTSDTTFNSFYPNTDEEFTEGQNRHHGLSLHGHARLDGSSKQNGQNSRMDDDDSYDLVTCICRKPYAGRPMIECSVCLTWLHLTCAKVRRNNIPETFICERCTSNTYSSNNNNNKAQKLLVKKKHRKSSGNYGKFTPGKGGKSPRSSSTSPVSSNTTNTSENVASSISSSSPPSSSNHQYQLISGVPGANIHHPPQPVLST